MTRISSVQKSTKLKRSLKAISPVIATLLMIAIAVVASLVVYAWVTGYIGGTTTTAGNAIQIQSFSPGNDINHMKIYVQNVGQGPVEILKNGGVYIDGVSVSMTSSVPIDITETKELLVDLGTATWVPGQRVTVKVVTNGGTITQTTGSGTSGYLIPTTLSCMLSSDSIFVNNPVTASGYLLQGTSGLVGKTVTITYHLDGQTDVAHTQTTGVAGAYSDSYTLTVDGDWTVTASFAGDSTYALSNSGAQPVNVNYVPATKIAFSAGTSQTLNAGQVSVTAIVVQRQDASNNPVALGTSDISVTLTTDSSGGAFYLDSAGTNSITSITINAGLSNSAGFYYKDTVAGDPTITAESSGLASDTATLNVDHASAASVAVTPDPAAVTAGQSQTFVATASDSYGNSWVVSTDAGTNWQISGSPGGSWGTGTSKNIYTTRYSGSYTVTATYSSRPDTATLNVDHASAASVAVTPDPAAVTAGQSQTFVATASDSYGNSWVVSTDAGTNWQISGSPGGSWGTGTSKNIYTTRYSGSYTVTATYSSRPDTATLNVDHASAASVAVTPDPAAVTAGQSQTFVATASDSYGNSWVVSTDAGTNWQISGSPGGSWGTGTSKNIYTTRYSGSYTVTATYSSRPDTATLNVDHASAASVAVTPDPAAVTAGQSQTFVATASDSYGNSWVVSTDAGTNWQISGSPGGSWGTGTSKNIYTTRYSGSYTVTATYSSRPDTATLNVNPITITLNPIADSYVRSDSSSTNYGSSQTLYTTSQRWTLLQFSIGSIPSGATIKTAQMQLTYSSIGIGTVSVYRITGTWTESGVTWNNKPAYSATATTSTIVNSPSTINFNVLTDIQAFLSGTANNGWILQTSNNQQSANSRESSSTKPALVITYDP